MAVKIASNISSLQAQRRLGEATYALGKVSEKLSSGLRINRAADDAAGLQISEGLRSDSRVYGQAVRNVNDGLSLLNIAQGAVQQLSNIVIRQAELAEQAINGTYSTKQRAAMNAEANALVKEYNRIIATTSFNDIKTLDGITNQLRMQMGYGLDGGFEVGVGSRIGFAAGDGIISNYGLNSQFFSNVLISLSIDTNGDSLSDIVSVEQGPGGYDSITIHSGNGDGTFTAGSSYEVISGADISGLSLGDINNDGIIDIIANHTGGFSALLGNSDGTFRAGRSFMGPDFEDVNRGEGMIADMNGDGAMDYVYADGNNLNIFVSNGDGTFQAGRSIAGANDATGLRITDLNGDGIKDIVVGDQLSGRLNIFIGNGNGTFIAPRSYSGDGYFWRFTTNDFNRDGVVDLAIGNYDTQSFSILLGNGNGSFLAPTNYAITSAWIFRIEAGDINGDNIVDLVMFDADTSYQIVTALGNGDGTFGSVSTLTPGAAQYGNINLTDTNQDGILDIILHDGGYNIFLGNADSSGRRNNWMGAIDLTTKYGAKQALMSSKSFLTRINQELGNLGAMQSRLASANQALAISRENFDSARSQLVDADVASESAALVATRIKQQAAAAILAQSNQQPALALRLLGTNL